MEHLPIWASIITALGGIGVLWTIIWTILNFRAKRKKESADADKAAAEAEKQHQENGQSNADWTLQKIKELDYYYKKQNKKLDGLQLFVTRLITVIEKNDFFYCSEIHCQNRKPPLGQFKTKIPKCYENENEIKEDSIQE